MALESTIEAYLVKRVEALGGICLKGAVPGRRFIDRVCILPAGLTAYAELKKPRGGRKEKHQIELIKWLEDTGHLAAFLNTREDVDDFIYECTRYMRQHAPEI